MKYQKEIFNDIKDEIKRQDKKHGEDRNRDACLWIAVLLEEVGEVARGVLERDPENTREELVQVAALAAQMISALDRGELKRE